MFLLGNNQKGFSFFFEISFFLKIESLRNILTNICGKVFSFNFQPYFRKKIYLNSPDMLGVQKEATDEKTARLGFFAAPNQTEIQP